MTKSCVVVVGVNFVAPLAGFPWLEGVDSGTVVNQELGVVPCRGQPRARKASLNFESSSMFLEEHAGAVGVCEVEVLCWSGLVCDESYVFGGVVPCAQP